ncbi:excinuclease ABC subunit UvrC [Candidatus Uhrbacteria bacterium]|nr:excinuclease ABC subunit UvrC [Candidatus Uhrbacteria bacterium]
MAIPKSVKIRNNKLPTTPGVYLFKDKKGTVVYVGKATNLKSRVALYWKGADVHSAIRANRRMSRTIEEMIDEVRRIDYVVTESVIEALILEANLIKKYQPRYNIREKDDKSFLYVVVTKERWPKVVLMRGQELKMQNVKCKIFGPYTSASAIRAALDLMRKWFPWRCMTRITTNKKNESPRKPCFDYHIGRCPGVCVGAITRREYMKNIRNVILMLEGKKAKVIKNLELRMKNESKQQNYEEAETLKRKIFALQHIRDVAVLTRGANYESFSNLRISNSQIRKFGSHSQLAPLRAGAINIFGRIEGYDISNISGTSAVGSMVVFEDGEPKKSEYRRFKIKTVRGINDMAMMREVLARRFRHTSWPRSELIVIDGGWGQVNAAREVLHERGINIPIVGIAKGFKRKQDRPIFEKDNPELVRIVENYKDLLLRVRDEAHRFAVAYHRKVRSRRLST